MNSLPNIAENLKAWRRFLGLKQSEIEEKAGLSHNTISRIENGKNSPHVSTLEKIAAAMEMSFEQLHFKRPPMRIAEEPANYDVLQLSSRIQDLPEANREVVLQAFNALLDQIET